MARGKSGRGGERKSWSRMSRAERAAAVAIWGMVAALFLSIGLTLLLS